MPRIRKDENGITIAKYETNPYMIGVTADLAANTRTKIQWIGEQHDKFIAKGDMATGEITDMQQGIVMGSRTYLDSKKFVKVYAQGIAAIFNLKQAGQKVFALIYAEVSTHKDTDTVYVPYTSKIGFSRATYYKGIKECIVTGLIAQTMSPGLYFINPQYIYNGDRFMLVTQYIKAQEQQQIK